MLTVGGVPYALVLIPTGWLLKVTEVGVDQVNGSVDKAIFARNAYAGLALARVTGKSEVPPRFPTTTGFPEPNTAIAGVTP